MLPTLRQDFADSDGDASDQPATCLNCLEGDWCFVLFDAASQYLLAAQSATPLKPIHWVRPNLPRLFTPPLVALPSFFASWH